MNQPGPDRPEPVAARVDAFRGAVRRLFGREPIADRPGGIAAAATCIALLLVVFFADTRGPAGATVGSIGLIPVGVAALLLSRRMVVIVFVFALVLRGLSAGTGVVAPLTALALMITYTLITWIVYLAAGSLRTSRRNAAHAERLRIVVEAAINLAAVSLSPTELVEQLMVYSVRTADADRGVVSRIEGDEMVVEASHDPSGQPWPVGRRWKIESQPLALEMMKTQQTVQGDVVDVSELSPELADQMARLRHILAVPLLVEGSVHGLLALTRFREPAFSEDEIASVHEVAKIASLALHRSLLHAEADRARSEAEATASRLRDSERKLAEAQHIAQLGSWEWDIPSNQVTWSDELYRIYDRNPADGGLTYEDFLGAVHSDDRGFVRRVIEDSFATGTPYGFEHRIVRPDGTIRTLQAFGRVVMDDSHVPVLMAGTGQDVTERKEAEQQLMAMTREREGQLLDHARRMETLEKVKGEFLLLGSHELRGPLTILTAYISLMEDGALGELPEKARKALPTMAAKGAAMKQLINEMLQTARLELGFQMELKPLDLREVALEAARSVLPLVGAGQRLVTQATEEAIPVVGDRERLIIILTNLLDNAIKYSDPQGEIAYNVSVAGDWALIAVRDRGLGIGQQDQAKLFTRFGRIITADNAHISGTGLGLYLAQGLAGMHGGRITVESEPGSGSVFTLHLPIAVSSNELPRRPPDGEWRSQAQPAVIKTFVEPRAESMVTERKKQIGSTDKGT